MTVTITALDKGFAIKYPFELKDAFRSAFPSAKWNAYAKQWEVGPRSGKRLEQWAAEVAPAAEKLAVLEEQELQEAELAKLAEQLASVQSGIVPREKELAAAGAVEARFAALRDKLEASKQQLSTVRQQAQEAQKKAAEAEKNVRNMLGEVLDWATVEAAMTRMARVHREVGRTAHDRFDEAQADIVAQRRLLRLAGWGSRGLDWLADANFNRPDRDAVGNMPRGALLDIYKINAEVATA